MDTNSSKLVKDENVDILINTYMGKEYKRPEDTNVFVQRLVKMSNNRQVKAIVLGNLDKDLIIQKSIELACDSGKFGDSLEVD